MNLRNENILRALGQEDKPPRATLGWGNIYFTLHFVLQKTCSYYNKSKINFEELTWNIFLETKLEIYNSL